VGIKQERRLSKCSIYLYLVQWEMFYRKRNDQYLCND